ncbi:hypothetical protein ACFVHB_17325 [Kitasatospora sp. NPDC127111]|uniref:hypothetical protein n=1 Tax=Kitasatospora sp. NPDC127111 TaxID=3345363 RepID=UPI003627E25D
MDSIMMERSHPTKTDDGTPGEYPVDIVAKNLRVQFPRLPWIRPTKIWRATTPEAAETLCRIRPILWGEGVNSPPEECFNDLTAPPPQKRNWQLAQDLRQTAMRQQALLVVGHQPQLSMLSDELINFGRRLRPWRRPPAPIDRAGLVCIELSENFKGKLLWAISYDDEQAAEQVRDKIKRKMETAKLLSGALTFGLTAIFGVLLKKDQFDSLAHKWSVQAAGVLLLLAAGLYFATLYAYDSLLMPQRFWAGRRSHQRVGWLVERPPSSAAWVLYQNMLRVWRNLFTTATCLTAAGIALLGYGALRLNLTATILIGVGLVLGGGAWIWRSRPALGTSD